MLDYIRVGKVTRRGSRVRAVAADRSSGEVTTNATLEAVAKAAFPGCLTYIEGPHVVAISTVAIPLSVKGLSALEGK